MKETNKKKEEHVEERASQTGDQHQANATKR